MKKQEPSFLGFLVLTRGVNNVSTQELETSRRALIQGADIANRSSGCEGEGEWSKEMSLVDAEL